MYNLRFLLLGCCLVIAGCQNSSNTSLTQTCPQTFIVRDLSRKTIKDPETGRTLSEVHLDLIRPVCRLVDGKLSFTPNPQITALRKNISKTSKIDVSYFVALFDKEGTVAAKKESPVTLEFEEKSRRVYEMPNEEFTFENLNSDQLTDYRVYIGFRLDHSEIAANKQRYIRPNGRKAGLS